MNHQMKKNINSPREKTITKNANSLALLSIKKLVDNKSVLYIATTYLDYLRVQQEITLLNTYAKQVYIIVSNRKNYGLRLLYVYLKSLFFFKKIDVVFIGFAPQLVLPFLKWRFFSKKVIIDFFISLHDTMIMDRKKFSQSSIISKALKFFDKITLKWADLVISDTQAHAEYFVKTLGCDKDKIQTLYLSADNNYYYPKVVKKPKKIQDKFVVLYFGTGLPLQGIDVILESLNLCQDKNIFFIMIGALDSSYCTNKNVKFIQWLPQEKLASHIAFADLCLAGHFCANIKKASRTIPGKAYIYEAMNKDIVLGDNNANRERYPQYYQAVTFVKMGSAIELNEVIMKKYWDSKNEK